MERERLFMLPRPQRTQNKRKFLRATPKATTTILKCTRPLPILIRMRGSLARFQVLLVNRPDTPKYRKKATLPFRVFASFLICSRAWICRLLRRHGARHAFLLSRSLKGKVKNAGGREKTRGGRRPSFRLIFSALTCVIRSPITTESLEQATSLVGRA